ncbi:Integrase core domain protein [Posidoniimonas polymericola]|uniref:Integrase core domain protein n=1 Tax=Posidoniimonas polymericola TaxID=2528002 RepID=A0A5C5XV20_9BACT|nr:integrase core domain-containing protein [Posidoniimonas polymericola]TWT66243.1 Integrase core domain protein [Posidoniimonas polymericola]
MTTPLQPWHLAFVWAVGWVNRQQNVTIEYLCTENRVLREQIGKKRILLTDDQRRRLAVKGKDLGRKGLESIMPLFTPDTILRWHRKLVAQKWDYSDRRKKAGRPPVAKEVTELILKIAKENRSWGYHRIQGALANLCHEVSDSTVANVLKAHGLEPAPLRKKRTPWKEFLKAHWDQLAAVDFTSVEVWTPRGLLTFYLLFVIEPNTRRVCFAGCTTSPNDVWMQQVARNLIDDEDGFLNDSRLLLMDRDAKFSAAFRNTVSHGGVHSLRLPPKTPNLNAHVERFMRSIKEECLDRMIFFGEDALRNAVREYLEHYHAERNHQGLDNRLIEAPDEPPPDGVIQCRERLGGMLKHYHRAAA